jgi:hypothetical protein
MVGEPPLARPDRACIVRLQWLLFVGMVVSAQVLTVVLITSLAALVPHDRAAVPLRNPVPQGQEFAYLDRVSHWPADWIAAVCKGPLYAVKRPLDRLPHATGIATCKAGWSRTAAMTIYLSHGFPPSCLCRLTSTTAATRSMRLHGITAS